MGHISSEENETEENIEEVGDSPIEVGNQFHEHYERLRHPFDNMDLGSLHQEFERNIRELWVGPRYATVSFSLDWGDPQPCAVCGERLHSRYPDDYPDCWKICCYCFTAWNYMNGISLWKWWQIRKKLGTIRYYKRREKLFLQKLVLKVG